MENNKTNLQSISLDSKIKETPQAKIDELIKIEKLLTEHQYLLNSLLDNLPEHIYFKDTESRFIRISKSQSDRFGLKDPSEAIGKTDFDFFSAEHAQKAFEDEQEIIRTGRTLRMEEKETWSDQPDTWVLTSKMPLYGDNGEIIGTFGISSDITDRKIAEEKLRQQSKSLQKQIREINILHNHLKEQASRDSLTGLSNRRTMDNALAQHLSDCQQLNQPFSIFIIDIDNFKQINDEYGHPVGDAILEKFGKCILTLTRREDFSGRFGGDEILMAFQQMSIPFALKKADDIRKKLGSISVQKDGEDISTTVSIGIATYPIHGNCIEELIKSG